jgi:hypothetical protein
MFRQIRCRVGRHEKIVCVGHQSDEEVLVPNIECAWFSMQAGPTCNLYFVLV